MSRRNWRVETHVLSGPNRHAIIYNRSYRLSDLAKLRRHYREKDKAAGKPKVKTIPLTTFLLRRAIADYIRDKAPKGEILNKIVVTDGEE